MCDTGVDRLRAETGKVFETGGLRNIFRQSSRIKSGKEGKKCSKQAVCGTYRNALWHIPEVFETKCSQNMMWHSASEGKRQ